MKRRSTIALTITAISIATAAVILLSIESIGGFDSSKRVISDSVEGTETQAVENPAPPEHPGFPPPAADNFSSSAGIKGNNNSFTEQASVRAPSAAIAFCVVPNSMRVM
ncbi:MAG: hypothetical protein M3299_17700 [Thermoproteota archaeon]|nr:hypothetical protein [Thermoproteota archaeon]